jgi:hypothetical protein
VALGLGLGSGVLITGADTVAAAEDGVACPAELGRIAAPGVLACVVHPASRKKRMSTARPAFRCTSRELTNFARL